MIITSGICDEFALPYPNRKEVAVLPDRCELGSKEKVWTLSKEEMMYLSDTHPRLENRLSELCVMLVYAYLDYHY